MKHIILIGFMGSGKSTIGRLLAKKLDVPQYDCDKAIESIAGMTIPEIFERQGEAAFRSYEHHVLADMLQQPPGVIMSGGGLVATEGGRALLRKTDAHIVWLKVDFATAATRIRSDSETLRPLFEDRHKSGARYRERQPLYENAATIIVDANQSKSAVVDAISREIS